jgi:SAM-dependent methyltransferase
VDYLLERGLTCVSVLDISGASLQRARRRLGPASSHVSWIEADVTGAWPVPSVDVWHDRAVFHFLTEPGERACYLQRVDAAVRPGGAVIIATFALDGPQKCSGLPVVRYSPETLAAQFGPRFRLEESVGELHRTPSGTTQAYGYCRFSRQG